MLTLPSSLQALSVSSQFYSEDLMLNISTYTTAVVVLLILLLIIWRSSYLLKLNLKAVGYFTVLSTISALLVIATDKLIS
jgi:hypothetical protein